MSKHRVLMLCVLAAATALFVPRPATAADSYEVVVEYDGPYYHVVNSPEIDQLVEDPLTTYAFTNPYGIAAFYNAADDRIVNFVLDSGNKRILAFEANMDIRRWDGSAKNFIAGGPPVAALDYDEDQIFLPSYAAPATYNVVPYSDVLKIDGETWSRVADATLFASGAKVYSIDYDATDGPEIKLPPTSLTTDSDIEIVYAASDYDGGGVYAFGLGDVDMGYRQAAATATSVIIDEASPVTASFEDLRSLFHIDVEGSATYDELWVLDAQDNSIDQDEFLQLYTVNEAGSAVGFREAYDDQLNDPSDVWVANGPGVVTASAAGIAALSHVVTATIWDANQVTGHSYRFAMSVANVTITDLTTSRVLLNSVAKTNIPNGAENVYLIPGMAIEFDETVANATTETGATVRTRPARYAFVADTGNDRIKIIGVPPIDATSGDDLPGDTYTNVAHPTSGQIYGVLANQYYYVTTPAAVPENWTCGTMTRPVKEGSISVIEDPDGTPITWTRVDNLDTAGPADKVYRLDWYEGRVVFGDGTHGALPTAATEYAVTSTTTPDVVRYGTPGGGAGQFSAPEASCALWSANLGCFVVYVSDTGNNRIQKLHFYPEDAALNTPPRVGYVTAWDTGTASTDILNGPTDIACVEIGSGSTAEVFVVAVDYGNDRVLVYDDNAFHSPSSVTTAPTFEAEIGGTGNTLGSFAGISGVSVFETPASEMEIYVSDGSRGTVTKYVLAPTPAITLLFTAGSSSELPESFPPSGSYAFRFTTTNAPEDNTVDFYYDTASTFNAATAKLCFAQGTHVSDDSPVTWNFASSPGGTPPNGTYYLYALLRNEAGIAVANDQTQSTELLTIDSDLVPAAQVRDDFDGDGTLLIAPQEVRTINLQLSYPDSVISVSFVGTFPANLMQIEAITPGSGWEGTEYTQRLFSAQYDNTAGTFTVTTGVTGVPTGLSGSGNFDMAHVLVHAQDVLNNTTRVASGSFALNASLSDMRDYTGAAVTAWDTRDLAIELAYVGDIATYNVGVSGTAPEMVPNPDGYMTSADFFTFILGWNGGAGTVHDPISDMGPVSDTSPGLVPSRDGELDVDDLLAFTSNWSWFNDNGYYSPTTLSGMPGIALAPLGDPVEGEATVTLNTIMAQPLPGQTAKVEINVSGAQMLTAAMVRVAYDPAQMSLLTAEKGDLLAQGGGSVLMNTIQRDGVVELCVGRLNPEQPGVSGNGRLATLTFQITAPPEAGFDYGYDLRDHRGEILARGSSELGQFSSSIARSMLYQNFPNPLNPQTSIVFALKAQEEVELAVYDMSGRLVKNLVRGAVEAGVHSIEWNGLDESGVPAPSGVYFYKLRAGELEQSRKLVVTR